MWYGLVSLCALFGALLVLSAPALAAAPIISEEALSSVDATEATIRAQINAEGSSTQYWVRYGTSEAYEFETPHVSVGAPVGPVGVVVHLTKLLPSTLYHFRFFAENVLGVSEGADVPFTTGAFAGSSTAVLPDKRAYELVSPLGNEGEVYVPIGPPPRPEDIMTARLFQASAGGDSVAYQAEAAVLGGNGATGPGEGNQWLATRSAEGWNTSDITPSSSGVETVYEGFSSDLSSGILQTDVQPPLTSGAPVDCKVLYSRSSSGGALQALLTATVTPGNCGHPHFAGASADGMQVLLQTEAALTEGAEEAEFPEGHEKHSALEPESGEPCQFSCNLYAALGGQLRLVNVLPDGESVSNATFGGVSGSENPPDFSNAISADGSRVFWTDTRPGPELEHIYLRKNAGRPASPLGPNNACTVPTDACTIPVSEGTAKYWTATSDGAYAYYTENEALWRFDTVAQTRERLASEGLKGEGAGVQGVIGANQSSEDGTYLYFVATGVLAANVNGHGEEAQAGAGKENLYELHDGVTKFIATLAPEDDNLRAINVNNLEQFGDWQPNLGGRTAEVTPDGRHLVFESIRSLTNYDNVNAVTRARDVEVFVYTAGTGRLVCASCSPTGVAPQIDEGNERRTALPVTQRDTYTSRWISQDGSRVFFNSYQPLTPQDANRVQDVYEWEREGTPSCPNATSASGGCVFLLSGGDSGDRSYFVDADADGTNVFFTHRGRLGHTGVPQEKMSLYDARVGGGFPEPSLACEGTGCQGVPPAPPIFAAPPSATFSGTGNFLPPPSGAKPKSKSKLARCKKDFVRKHGKCVKKPKAKKRAKKAKKSAKGRK
jgi:hypothetical protein